MTRVTKRLATIGVAVMLCLSLPVINALAEDANGGDSKESTANINATTYNLLSSKYDEKFPDNPWADRRSAAAKIIKQDNNNPDVLAVQEGQVSKQIDELATGLGDTWAHYAADDDISPRAIFWRESMFDAVDEGTEEIIDPDVDGYKDKRYSSWVRLKHLDTGEQLLVFNAHVPTGGTEELHEVRYNAALTLADVVKKQSKDNGGIPAIVLGDFNSYYDTVIGNYKSAPKTLTENGLPDTYGAAAADSRVNPDYKSNFDITKDRAEKAKDGSKRLDYIHTYPADDVEVLDWRMVINFQEDSDVDLKTPVPSDHHPTASKLQLTWN